MEITDFTFRIILLLLPGLITFFIIDKLTEQKKNNYIINMTSIIIYSFVDYSVYSLLKVFFSLVFKNININVNFLNCLTDKSISISWIEIIVTSFISVFIAGFISKLINESYFHKNAQHLNLTNKFSDIDVWSYLFNSKNDFQVIIRDIENNLTYQGYPQAFSNGHGDGELLLVNVKVYRYEDSELLYTCDGMYYKFNSEKINFEIQVLKGDKNEKSRTKNNK